MELKWKPTYVAYTGAESSNCTFMELKYRNRRRRATDISVLIVPLWN